MADIQNRKRLKKNLRLLLASVLLYILVYIKDYSWTGFGNTIYWIISFSLLLYCGVLIVWLLVNIYQWVKAGFKGIYSFWIFLLTIGVLWLSIYGMR
jgi:CDP-diglyceride synthetase